MRSPIKSRIARNPSIPVAPAMRASRPMMASPAMPPMGGSPSMAPTGMKKGGKVKSGAAKSGPQSIVGKSTSRGSAAKSGPQSIVGKSTSRGSAAKSGPQNIEGKSSTGYKKGGMTKKPGLAIMIAVGKSKKGK